MEYVGWYNTCLAMDPALAFTYHTMSLLVLSPVCPACFASHAKTVVTLLAIRFGWPRDEGRKMSAYAARLGTLLLMLFG